MKFLAWKKPCVLPSKPLATTKWVFFMRLSFLIMTSVLLGIQLLIASPGSAQNIDEVKVTVALNGAPLKLALNQIEKQTSFRFAYVQARISGYNNLYLSKEERTLSKTLSLLLENTSLKYQVKNNTILLLQKADPVFDEMAVQQNSTTPDKKFFVSVSGIVRNESKEPLSGVSITEKGANNGTTSNDQGRFLINVENGNATLVFSYAGYASREVEVANRSVIDLELVPDIKQMDDVVVVGYGTQKKENLTGAVSVVKMEKVLGSRPVTNLGSALQGAVPGLQITGSAVPGQSKSFNIRGFTSINGGEPLILVDNVPADINLVNPEDIESVSVLKDASSAAIYGARGAFGVILVTTKRAKKNSKPQLTYSNNFGYQKSINRPKEASIIDILKTHLVADNDGKYYAEGQNLQKWIGYVEAYNNGTFAPKPSEYFEDGRYIPDGETAFYYLQENNTNRAIIDNYGFQQIQNFSADGGGDNITYRMSFGYTDQDGILITNKDRASRTNINSYVNADITPWLSQSVDFRFANGKRSYVEADGNIYSIGLYFPTFYPQGIMPRSNDINGPKYPVNTPKNYLLLKDPVRYSDENTRIYSRTSIHPFKGFEGIIEYTSDKINSDKKDFNSPFLITNDQMGILSSSNPSTGRYRNDKSVRRYNILNAYATYQKSFNGRQHNIKAMTGYSRESSYYENMWSQGDDLINLAVPSLSGATGQILTGDTYREFAIESRYFRLNYDYQGRYLAEINGRYDGSSKFPKSNRFGFFPSFSVGWRVAQEQFMSWSDNWLNELKLRASWGQVGNQAIDEYGFNPTMRIIQSNWIQNGTIPVTLASPSLVRQDFTWEVVETSNLGLDMSLFKNKLQATFEFYQRDTKGMLIPGSELPSVLGTSAPQQNAADLRTKGWELSLSWNNKIRDLGYEIGFNVFDSRSKITRFSNEAGVFYDINSRQSQNRYREGMTIGEIWGYTTDRFYTIDDFQPGWEQGVWKLKDKVTTVLGNNNIRPGDIMFKNIRDDASNGSVNQIDPGRNNISDPGDRTIIGNETPRFQFGFNCGVNWKNFDLSIFLQGTGKRDAWLDGFLRFPFSTGGAFGTVYTNQLDYWKPTDLANKNFTPVKADAFFPRLHSENNNVGSNYRIQTKYLADASYLRVKNITLAYNLPAPVTKKIRLSGARVFFSTENLLTFTSLPNGYDPERLNWGYPFFATYSFGIKCQL